MAFGITTPEFSTSVCWEQANVAFVVQKADALTDESKVSLEDGSHLPAQRDSPEQET